MPAGQPPPLLPLLACRRQLLTPVVRVTAAHLARGCRISLGIPKPSRPPCLTVDHAAPAAGDSGRCYLAYTPLGCITLKQEEDHNVVEVGRLLSLAFDRWRQLVCREAADG